MLITTTLFIFPLTAGPVGLMPAIQTCAQRAPTHNVTAEPGLDPVLRDLIVQVRAMGVTSRRFGMLDEWWTGPDINLGSESICSITAALAARAGMREAQEDLLLAIGNCLNTTDPLDLAECLEGLWENFAEQIGEARHIYAARVDVCDLTGENQFDPEIDPDDFLHPSDYATGGGNPYYPLETGMTWVYEKEEDGELERVTLRIEEGTRTLMGVECAIVHDIAELFEIDDDGRSRGDEEGELIEETFDYLAVDKDLNVWYFGEDTWEVEDGLIVNTDGRWLAGEDFGKPGILMHADPIVGTTYRQEFALDEAEDVATMLSLTELVMGPLGPFDNCRKTEDFSPLEPGKSEFKFFADGIGLVREEDPDDPESGLDLVDFYVEK